NRWHPEPEFPGITRMAAPAEAHGLAPLSPSSSWGQSTPTKISKELPIRMTRKLQAVLFALLLTATGSALAQAAAATTAAAGTTKIGVIDIQTAILATNEGQRDFGALQTKFQPKQTELQTMSKEVDDMKKQLETQQDKLNEEARATMVKNLEVKKKSSQRTLEDAQNEFEGQKNEIMRNLGNKVYATLDKYAKENGFSLVLDVS